MVAVFRERRDLALENLALRQRLGVLKRKWSSETQTQRPNVLGRALSSLAMARDLASDKS